MLESKSYDPQLSPQLESFDVMIRTLIWHRSNPHSNLAYTFSKGFKRIPLHKSTSFTHNHVSF